MGHFLQEKYNPSESNSIFFLARNKFTSESISVKINFMGKRFIRSLLTLCLPLMLVGCSHLFYHPTRYIYVDPKKLTPPPEQVEIPFRDGKIVAWYFKPIDREPKANILFFHGNAQNISSHFFSLFWIIKEGYGFLIFDYPGYGGSSGEPTPESTTASGDQALQWLLASHPKTPVAIFGQSLGGNIALYTAAKHKQSICLVTVESTFKSYKKVAQRTLAKNPITWALQPLGYLLVSDKYSAGDHIAEISPTPLMVIHSRTDRVVSFENGEDVFNAAKTPKEFLQLPEGEHIQAFTGPHNSVHRKKFLAALEDCHR